MIMTWMIGERMKMMYVTIISSWLQKPCNIWKQLNEYNQLTKRISIVCSNLIPPLFSSLIRFSDIEMKTTPQTQSGYHRGPPPSQEKPGLSYGAGASREPSPYRATPDPVSYRPVPQQQTTPYPPAGGNPAYPPSAANYPPPAPVHQADVERENKGYASESWA